MRVPPHTLSVWALTCWLHDAGKKLAPGKQWSPGDWAADIDQGGYQLLLEGARREGAKWELVRTAAVLQLAGLALCPLHRCDILLRKI
jgi:hypothetical protein